MPKKKSPSAPTAAKPARVPAEPRRTGLLNFIGHHPAAVLLPDATGVFTDDGFPVLAKQGRHREREPGLRSIG